MIINGKLSWIYTKQNGIDVQVGEKSYFVRSNIIANLYNVPLRLKEGIEVSVELNKSGVPVSAVLIREPFKKMEKINNRANRSRVVYKKDEFQVKRFTFINRDHNYAEEYFEVKFNSEFIDEFTTMKEAVSLVKEKLDS